MTNEFQLPGNSHSKRSRPEETTPKAEDAPKLEQITTGEVKVRKSRWKQFTGLFFSGTPRQAAGHVVTDLIIPTIKITIVNALVDSIQVMVHGEVKSKASRLGLLQDERLSRFQYNNPSANIWNTGARKPEREEISSRARGSHDFDEIVFSSRVEAGAVLDALYFQIQKYGVARVSELYELTGLPGHYTDDKFGWEDLRGSSVERSRNGYILNIPKPEALD